jgi:hypothetical protein
MAIYVTLGALIGLFILPIHLFAEKGSGHVEGPIHSLALTKTIPGQLNYQGYLADASDSTGITATLEMTYRLFDSETKGAELWAETHPMVSVSNGLFHVLLGGMIAFPNGLFDGSQLWLQTEIGTEVLSPRKPLASVAYSQLAENADHASTAEWATDAQHAIHADTAAYSPSASVWTVSGDDVYRETGKVGIGTTSPVTELDVSGSVNASAYYGDGSSLTGISGTTDADWIIDGADVYHQTGNVGIGTATPERKLHIAGANPRILIAASSSNPEINFQNSADAYSEIWALYKDATTDDLRLFQSGDKVTVQSGTGNVGIGKDDPSAMLDVSGDINSDSLYKIDGQVVLSASWGSTSIGVRAGDADALNSGTFVGYEAGHSNEGTNNTFMGRSSGYSNNTGHQNIFIGNGAGYFNTSGYGNTFVGHWAGYSHDQGIYNVCFGKEAGYSLDTGENNTCIGSYAGWNNETGSRNVFIGFGAGQGETGSDKLYIANGTFSDDVLIHGDFSSGRVGIGTTNLQEAFQVQGNSSYVTSKVKNDYTNGNSWFVAENDAQNWYMGVNGIAGDKFQIALPGDPKFVIATDGKVGIGMQTPSYKLDVAGDINTTGEIRRNGSTYNHPDYVFEPDYELLPLEELNDYLTQNRHLPGMPSAEEVKEEGVKLFEQNRLLLEKLEESYLYIVELQKKITELQKTTTKLEYTLQDHFDPER